MSALAETSPNNGEWEVMSENADDDVRNDVNIFKEHSLVQSGEIKKLTEEINKTRKEKDDEIAILKAKVAEKEYIFSLDEWMKVDMEELRMSTDSLNEKLVDVFKAIREKQTAKSHSKSSIERKRWAKKVEKLEDLCEKITTDLKRKNKEYVDEIEVLLNDREQFTDDVDKPSEEPAMKKSRVVSAVKANRQISPVTFDSFLGTYSLDAPSCGSPRFGCASSISFTKPSHEIYHCRLTFHQTRQTMRFDSARISTLSGCNAWIEGTKLKMNDRASGYHKFELKSDGLFIKYEGVMYRRNDRS